MSVFAIHKETLSTKVAFVCGFFEGVITSTSLAILVLAISMQRR